MSYSPLKILMRGSGKSLLISIFLSAIFIIQPSTLSASTQVSGVISKNTVWTLKNHPYLVDSDLHIYGNSADKTVTLTIEPGVEVRFGYNTRLVLGWSRHQKGCIVAKGTKKKPITFTAYNKEPGSWQGIYFARGAAAGKSILKHCIVEYGGYNQVGNIYIEEGSPTITRCTIRKGSGHGIHIFGYSSPKITRSTISHNQGDGIHAVRGDSTPEISGNTITKNNGHALAVRAHVVSRAIIQNRLGDNGKNSIRTVGTIRRGSHTWTARFPYFIDGDAAVYGETGKPAASLTLMPGTVLQFADGGGLKIGGSTGEKGVLVARSAGIKPITFTAASRKPGAWKGIRFADGAVDRKNIMEHCIVEYGGKQQDANIAIESCSPVITHCTIRDGSRHGIRVDNHIHSRPQITGSTITGNAGNGIHSEGDKSMPVISGNTLLKNNGCPILIGVQAVGGIEDNNKIRKNGNNNIYVRPGRLQGNHTWNVRHPLLISGYVDVLSERDTPPASLELMPGTVLQFADYAHLKIGEYHGKKGLLFAKGDPNNPIIFTAVSQKPGAWKGIIFSDGAVDGKNILMHCIVEYGGYRSNGSILIERSAPVITNCTIRKGSSHGVHIDGHIDSRPQITGSVVTGHARDGIHSDGGESTPLISGNTICKNNGYPIAVGANAVHGIDEYNCIGDNGNNGIYVSRGRLKENHTWKARGPFIISGDVHVHADRDKPPASLELIPGTVLRFADKTQLKIGEDRGRRGMLFAKGDPGNPIVFTAVSQKPGAWKGIVFSDGAVDGKNILDHCTVEYGGYRSEGSIHVERTAVTIAHSTIQKSSSYGISSDNAFTGVYYSSIRDNKNGGIRHSGSGSVNAEYTWWGDPSGPSGEGSGTGNAVSKSVDYNPWLTHPVDPSFHIKNINVSPGTFSNKGGNTTFQVSFSSPADWKVIVTDPAGHIVTGKKGTGSHIDWQWSGKDKQGNPLKNGKYKFVLEGKSNAMVTGFVEIKDSVPLAEITSPDAGGIVPAGSSIHIHGTAKGPGFQSYTLEYGPGYHPSAWEVLCHSGSPVNNNILSKTPFSPPLEKNYTGVLRLRVRSTGNEETIVKRYINVLTVEKDAWTQNRFFSPNDDREKDRTVINAGLNFPNQWQIKVMAGQNKTIRTFTGFSRVISQPWDGTDEKGHMAPDGSYSYQVSLLHPFTGEQILGMETTGTLDTVPPALEVVSPAADSVLAGAHTIRGTVTDNHFKQWRLDLGAGKSPQKWIQIHESEQAVSSGPLAVLDTGKLRKSLYTLRFRTWDHAGNRASLHRVVKVFNLKKPGKAFLFSPNGDGMSDIVTLVNSLTLPGDWEITVINANAPGRVIRKYNGSGKTIKQTWDGKNNAGQTVKDGVYTARLTAVPGSRRAPRLTCDMARMTVDNTPPRLVFHRPSEGGNLFNIAPLRVTVDDANLLYYSLCFRQKTDPALFYHLCEGNNPIQNAVACTWDTYKHPNGRYMIRFTALDRVLNRSVSEVAFDIDNIIISNVSNTPVFFDPLKGEKTHITYEIDRKARITVSMLQRDPVNGETLAVKATPLREVKRKKGKNTETWDGRGDKGSLLPFAYYPYRITAKRSGRIRHYDSPFITGAFEPSISGAAFIVKDIVMTPTAGGLDITYKLEKDSRVDIQVGEFAREGLLHHLVRDTPLPAGDHTFSWNLRDDRGKLAIPKKEKFQLSMAVKGIPLGDTITVTRSKASVVKNVRVDNLLMQPNYDETASIRYELEENVDNVTVDILDPNGNHFRRLEGLVRAGSHAVAWDGRNDNGRLAGMQGDYRFTLKVARAGKKDTIRRGAFVLRGYYKFDESGVYESPELILIEVRDDQGKLIAIEVEESK